MAVMMSNLYRALLRVGASGDDASRTAEEVANYGNRIGRVEGRPDLLTWTVGFNLALSVAVLFKLFR